MVFGYLLLGHLVGDFTFQTNRIAANKTKNWKWTLIHALIVSLFMLVFTVSFQPDLLEIVFLNGLFHFLIDLCKTKIFIKRISLQFLYFIIDQVLHISIILFTIHIKEPIYINALISDSRLMFLIMLVVISSFSSIWIQYVLKIIFADHTTQFFIGNEKLMGNVTRILVFVLGYVSMFSSKLLLILAIIFAIFINVHNYSKAHSNYLGKSYFIVKLIMNLIVPLIGIYFLESLMD